MKCSEIKDNLSSYIDGVLNAEDTASVEDHIKGCENCREELSALRSLVEELNSLDSVKPPPDFLEKLNERIEAESGFSKLMSTLFLPFRIKIPLELATAAITAVLVVFILNLQQEEERIVNIPKISGDKSAFEESAAKEEKPDSKKLVKPGIYLKKPVVPEKDKMKGEGPVREKRKSQSFSEDMADVRKQPKKRHELYRAPTTERAAQKPSPKTVDGAVAKRTVKSDNVSEAVVAGKLDLRDEPIRISILVKYGLPAESRLSTHDSEDIKEEAAEKQILKDEPEESVPLEPNLRTKKSAYRIEEGKVSSREGTSKLSNVKEVFQEILNLIGIFGGKKITSEYDESGEWPKEIKAAIPAANFTSFCTKIENVTFMKFSCAKEIDSSKGELLIPIIITFEKMK
ncbi:zf-HC2 domain-containing protein [Thermodesulfobacteriota bacterium]